LAAASIEHRVGERDGRFELYIRPEDEAVATEALAGFDAEGEPEQQPPAPDVGWSPLGLQGAIAFAAMLLVTGVSAGGSRWFQAGAAAAALIRQGEWWRAVTALTLHQDMFHAVVNGVAALVFFSAVGRWMGSGLGALVIVVSASLANVLAAVWHKPHVVSVGASTATFAALGIVAGLQVARRLRLRTRRGYAWVPLGAALALFAMTGVGGEGTDYEAHLCGLGVGAAAGVGWAVMVLRRGWRPLRPWLQALIGAFTVAAVAGCWWLAFRRG
jgi:membrane associated rhomboid family serine protease